MMKKGFTLIEIIISLVISAVIGMYIMEQNSKSNFNSDVSKFSNLLVKIIETGIIDPNIGFTSGACGGNGTYAGLSAKGVDDDCTKWGYRDSVADNDYFDGVHFLGAYTNDGKGCKVSMSQKAGDDSIFLFSVDCSSVNYKGEDRYKKYVEDRVRFVLESSLSTIIDDTKTNDGTIDDGIISFESK